MINYLLKIILLMKVSNLENEEEEIASIKRQLLFIK